MPRCRRRALELLSPLVSRHTVSTTLYDSTREFLPAVGGAGDCEPASFVMVEPPPDSPKCTVASPRFRGEFPWTWRIGETCQRRSLMVGPTHKARSTRSQNTGRSKQPARKRPRERERDARASRREFRWMWSSPALSLSLSLFSLPDTVSARVLLFSL